MNNKKINLHLISDSTGETLGSIARAVLSQFENVETNDFVWSLTRTKTQLDKALEAINQYPGIVLYTIMQEELIEELRKKCHQLQLPCIPVLSPIIAEFSKYLNMNITQAVGRQHLLDQQYFSRVGAISYTITHDDGQASFDYYEADIIIIGVSRTSKSPTSIYLSLKGYKVANIPFVSIETIPEIIYELKKPLIVGLVINPEKLVNIRQTRLNSIGENSICDYTDIEKIQREINESKKLFAKLQCHIIDVTKKSVEETSAKIVQLLQDKKLEKK
jgi:regulator of PEP synthase PpsR (kinase-PPPase family)